MQTSQEYEAHAVKCQQLAHVIELPETKAMLLEMAQEWAKLAQQAREKEKSKT